MKDDSPLPPPLPPESSTARPPDTPPPLPEQYRTEQEIERRVAWRVGGAIVFFFVLRALGLFGEQPSDRPANLQDRQPAVPPATLPEGR